MTRGRPFAPWLLRIVTNCARDLARRRSVRLIDSIPEVEAATGRQPDSDAELNELGFALDAALRQLPERQRTAVVLYDVEGYSHREVAEILDIPDGTARSEVHHGRHAMRKALQAWHEEMK